jgi:hypothetical protein
VGTKIFTGLLGQGACACAPPATKSIATNDKPIFRISFTLYSA